MKKNTEKTIQTIEFEEIECKPKKTSIEVINYDSDSNSYKQPQFEVIDIIYWLFGIGALLFGFGLYMDIITP